MSFSEMSEKQLSSRIKFLTEKMETIWEDINPKMREFNELKSEFEMIMEELENRNSE